MIHFNPSTQTFNLVLATSSTHSRWMPRDGWCIWGGGQDRPARDADLLSGQEPWERTDTTASFETQTQPDELLTFGDVTFHEVSLKVEFHRCRSPRRRARRRTCPFGMCVCATRGTRSR